MADPVRVAAIGLGRLGAIHAENLAHHVPGAALGMVVDSDPERAAAAGALYDVPHGTDPLVACIDAGIDAVEICTASDSHAALIEAAAEAGKAIFCEKPIALSLDDADRAMAAVGRNGVPLQIGFMRRFDPAYLEARRLIDAGEIGQPLTFRSASLDGSISPSRDFLARCGGIFVDVALHDFDLARWLMRDEVVAVHAIGSVLVHQVLRAVDDVDNAAVTLRFARGGIGMVQVSHTAVHGYEIATEVLGDRGGVRAEKPRQTDVWRYTGDGRVEHDTVADFPARFARAYLDELVAFITSLRDRSVPIVGGADARAALRIALAARESLRTGETIVLS